MSATPDSTLANPEQLIADRQRQLAEREAELAECKAERDEALQRETATAEVLGVLGCNRRYLEYLSSLDDFSAGIRTLDRLTQRPMS